MKPYFAKMQDLGKELKEARRKRAEPSREELKQMPGGREGPSYSLLAVLLGEAATTFALPAPFWFPV